MPRGDVLEPRRAHGAGPKNNLARPRVERLEELDDATHRLSREHIEVDDDLQVVRQDYKHLERRAHREVRPIFDVEMLRRSTPL